MVPHRRRGREEEGEGACRRRRGRESLDTGKVEVHAGPQRCRNARATRGRFNDPLVRATCVGVEIRLCVYSQRPPQMVVLPDCDFCGTLSAAERICVTQNQRVCQKTLSPVCDFPKTGGRKDYNDNLIALL